MLALDDVIASPVLCFLGGGVHGLFLFFYLQKLRTYNVLFVHSVVEMHCFLLTRIKHVTDYFSDRFYWSTTFGLAVSLPIADYVERAFNFGVGFGILTILLIVGIVVLMSLRHDYVEIPPQSKSCP